MKSIIQYFDQIDKVHHIHPSATKLYWKLVAKADTNGAVEDSFRSLVQQTRLSINTIREASATLVQLNLIHITLKKGKTSFKILYFQQEPVSIFDTLQVSPRPTVSKTDTLNSKTVSKIDTAEIFPTQSVSKIDTPIPTIETSVSKTDTPNSITVSKTDTVEIFPTQSVSKIDTPTPTIETSVSKIDTPTPTIETSVSKIDTPNSITVSKIDTPTLKNAKTVSKIDTRFAVNNNNNITKEIIIINPSIENQNLGFLLEVDFQTKVAIQLKNPNYASGLIYEFQNKNFKNIYENTFKAEQHFWNWLSKVRDNYAYQTRCHDVHQTIQLNQAKEKWLQIASDVAAMGFDNSPIIAARIKKQDADKIIVEVPSPNTVELLEEEPLLAPFFESFKKYFGEKILLEYELMKHGKK